MKPEIRFFMDGPVTTSSAGEWQHIERPAARVVQCPDCGGYRRQSDGPHAPRVVGDRRLDCMGREVAR